MFTGQTMYTSDKGISELLKISRETWLIYYSSAGRYAVLSNKMVPKCFNTDQKLYQVNPLKMICAVFSSTLF